MRLVYVILLACAQTNAGGAVAAPCECRLTDDDVYDCTVSAPLNSSSPLYGSLNRALQAATSDVTSARRIAVTCTDRYDVRIEPGLLAYYQQLDVLTIATCRLEYLPQLVTANCDKYVYRALSALEVTDTGISRIAPSAFCGLFNLARLRLVYNELTTLTKDMLDGLGPSMSSLDLASNFIDSLESNVFADLTNLEELHLEGNRLREVSAELFAPFADRLKLLTLDYNELRTPADGAFKGMRNLEKLQLGSNPLSGLPTDIFADLGNLDFLSIDNINMTTLDPRLIAPLTRLTTLYVAWNQITDVVAFMDNMTAYASARPLDSAVDVVCSGNPFYCDCELVTSDGALVAAFQRQADVSVMMRYHELNCHEPFYSDYALNNLANYPNEFDKMRSDVLRLNDCYEQNFTSCSLATAGNGTKGAVLYCDYLGITELREFAADWAEIAEYNVVDIFLDGNFLDDFNLSDTGLNLEKPLRILSLSQNNIDEGGLSLKEMLTHGVTSLGLAENNLTQLPDKDFMLANSLASLDVQVISLVGNPFRCDCETSYLKRWFSNNAQRINKPNETFCTSGPLIEQWEIYRRTAIADLPDDVFTCDSATEAPTEAPTGDGGDPADPTFPYVYLSLLVVPLALLAGVAGVGVYVCRRRDVGDDGDESATGKEYDAFIAFSSQDFEFVARTLVPGLEGMRPPYRLCVHDRDFHAGKLIMDSIIQAIEVSRSTVLLLSNHFIQSNWCKLEFQASFIEVLANPRYKLIVIVCEPIEMDSLESDLRFYIKTHTYLEIKDSKFWEKLCAALPRPLAVLEQRDADGTSEQTGTTSQLALVVQTSHDA